MQTVCFISDKPAIQFRISSQSTRERKRSSREEEGGREGYMEKEGRGED